MVLVFTKKPIFISNSEVLVPKEFGLFSRKVNLGVRTCLRYVMRQLCLWNSCRNHRQKRQYVLLSTRPFSYFACLSYSATQLVHALCDLIKSYIRINEAWNKILKK